MTETCAVGSVVLPASNGLLSQLGHDVVALREKALGIVVDSKASKCLVKFPEIQLSSWVEKEELLDVWLRAKAGEAEYKNLVPDFHLNIQRIPLVWTMFRLIQKLQCKDIVSLEKAKVSELIPEVAQPTSGLKGAILDESIWGAGLAFDQWRFGTEAILDEVLGSKLVWARVMPLGMHRLELLVLFRERSV
jgi:hypothetical protein